MEAAAPSVLNMTMGSMIVQKQADNFGVGTKHPLLLCPLSEVELNHLSTLTTVRQRASVPCLGVSLVTKAQDVSDRKCHVRLDWHLRTCLTLTPLARLLSTHPKTTHTLSVSLVTHGV